MTKPKAAAAKPAPKPVVATAPKPVAIVAASPAERRDLALEQHSLVAASPRAFEEAAADIDKVVAGLADRAEVPVSYLANDAAGWGELVYALGRHAGEHDRLSPAVLLAWAAPDALAAALKRDLEASYDALPKPMAAKTKAGELAKLNREIASIETEMAGVFWAAVDAGMALDPPDIDGGRLIGLAD